MHKKIVVVLVVVAMTAISASALGWEDVVQLQTGEAYDIAYGSARIRGTVDVSITAQGEYWISYGLFNGETCDLNQETEHKPWSSNPDQLQVTSWYISGLNPGRFYCYRLVGTAQNFRPQPGIVKLFYSPIAH